MHGRFGAAPPGRPLPPGAHRATRCAIRRGSGRWARCQTPPPDRCAPSGPGPARGGCSPPVADPRAWPPGPGRAVPGHRETPSGRAAASPRTACPRSAPTAAWCRCCADEIATPAVGAHARPDGNQGAVLAWPRCAGRSGPASRRRRRAKAPATRALPTKASPTSARPTRARAQFWNGVFSAKYSWLSALSMALTGSEIASAFALVWP